jgi:FkbM family methyltransferase
MVNGPQYNEREILEDIFGKKRNGMLVEVGAANGVDNSHTRFLIVEMGWSAVLIEPHPLFFKQLQNLYANLGRVTLVNKAILDEETTKKFYLYGQVSRFLEPHQVEPFHKQYRRGHDGAPVDVECTRLDILLNQLGIEEFDFLTIDAEGSDLAALHSLNWSRWRPHAVCVEHSMPKELLDVAMNQYKYKFARRSAGNSFFVCNG